MVFPAHAGMIPQAKERKRNDGGVPRTRGDDPPYSFLLVRTVSVFPAHAGMIPAARSPGR